MSASNKTASSSLTSASASVADGLDSVGNSASHSFSNNNNNNNPNSLSSSSSGYLSSGRLVVVCKEVFDDKSKEPTEEGKDVQCCDSSSITKFDVLLGT